MACIDCKENFTYKYNFYVQYLNYFNLYKKTTSFSIITFMSNDMRTSLLGRAACVEKIEKAY